MEYDFESPPSLGYVHERHGNRYVLARSGPCLKRDGTPGWALTWRGTCATCGAPFETDGGLRTNGLVRRCQEHRGDRAPATAEAKEAVRAARKRGVATNKARGKANRAAKRAAAKIEASLREAGLFD